METFKTDDILLASFLLTNTGINLIDIVEDYSRHFLFILSNPELCTKLKQKYLNNAPASALELFSKREILISEIKNKYREGNK